MSDIRLRYSIIINYASILVRTILLAISSVIIARKLDPTYYALWGLVLSLTNIYQAPTGFWKTWSMRSYRRGIKEAYETGLALTITWILICAVLHLLVLSIYSPAFNADIFALLYISFIYMGFYILFQYEFALASIIYPEYIGYANFLYGTLRTLLVILFLVILEWSYLGVLTASTLTLASTILLFYVKLRQHHGKLQKRVNIKMIKNWLSMFPIPILGTVNQYLNSLDRIVVSAVTLNELPVAYLTASYSATLPLKIDRNVLLGLYARLLQRKSRYDVEETIRIISLPLIFLLATLTMLAAPIMSLMNPKYADAYPVLWALTFKTLINSYYQVFSNAIKAVDKTDTQQDISPATLRHSKLFTISLADLIKNAGGVLIASYLLLIYKNNNVLSALAFPLGLLITFTAALIWIYHISKKTLNTKFPTKDVITFAVSAFPTILYYQLSGATKIVVNTFIKDAPLLLLHVTIGGIIYAATLTALSPWTRTTLKKALKTISTKFT